MKKQATAPPLEEEKLYPELPAAEDDGQSYRLQKISEIHDQLEQQRDARSALYKKYRKAINAVDSIDTTLTAASIGMGMGGVALLTTIVAAPIVLGLEIAAAACGLVGVAAKFASKRLLVKARKHDEIRVLAESKINSISSHTSKALRDGHISDAEYRLVLDEIERYSQMKVQIKAQAHKAHVAAIDEKTKNEMREEIRANLLKKLEE